MKLKDMAVARINIILAREMQTIGLLNKRLRYFADELLQLEDRDNDEESENYVIGPDHNYVETIMDHPLFDEDDVESDDSDDEEGAYCAYFIIHPGKDVEKRHGILLKDYTETVEARRKVLAVITRLQNALAVAEEHFGDE